MRRGFLPQRRGGVRTEKRRKREEKTMIGGREEGGVVVERGVGVKVGSESTL